MIVGVRDEQATIVDEELVREPETASERRQLLAVGREPAQRVPRRVTEIDGVATRFDVSVEGRAKIERRCTERLAPHAQVVQEAPGVAPATNQEIPVREERDTADDPGNTELREVDVANEHALRVVLQ